MPELPEVETVRRGLEKYVVGKQIKDIRFAFAKIAVTGLDSFRPLIDGQMTIQAMRRRGKYLIFEFGDLLLISHLRMEGKYLMFDRQENVPDNKHFHVFFTFTDNSVLVYQDVRKFGTMEILLPSQEVAYFVSKKLGPEPSKETFKLAPFESTLLSSSKKIKPYLLEQTLVAGLGNIYVDEVLWAAKVHPLRLSSSLKKTEIKRLHDETIRILQLGIEKGGSTIRTYRNALGEDGTMQQYLQVYGLTGQPCQRCGAAIEKIQVGGRGSHYCPKCQKI
ncbi:DNA-formamidopyrimidine glycosylase [Streptococcus thoraltensis]|uniref:DNA-formamidopyrimidine glycosylase n=1 Tax=Streptococcus thoraltensis TaxID=55085 RepID=UPI0003700D96|nr:DNA-formamidopyrimidine glycosylase [Streptococcus thoraltensis]MDY4761486.1 DNA-formamidopyrimidine glycosylase [Streptococcus thoraltensis]